MMENRKQPTPPATRPLSLDNVFNQPPSVFRHLKYISGLPSFDLYIYSNRYIENNHQLTVNEGDRNIFLHIQRGPFVSSKNLYKSQIHIMETNRFSEVILRKDATVAGKAILGMSKLNKLYTSLHKLLEKDQSDLNKLNYPDYFLTIVYQEKNFLRNILFGYPDLVNAN